MRTHRFALVHSRASSRTLFRLVELTRLQRLMSRESGRFVRPEAT